MNPYFQPYRPEGICDKCACMEFFKSLLKLLNLVYHVMIQERKKFYIRLM